MSCVLVSGDCWLALPSGIPTRVQHDHESFDQVTDLQHVFCLGGEIDQTEQQHGHKDDTDVSMSA